MGLFEQINQDIKDAMRQRDEARLRALRNLKSAFMLAKTEKGGRDLTSERELQIVRKLIKQREDSLKLYREQKRGDLALKEEEELKVLSAYLPEQMPETELRAYLENLIREMGAETMKDMGRVMGKATSELAGKADNKMVASIVRELLSS